MRVSRTLILLFLASLCEIPLFAGIIRCYLDDRWTLIGEFVYMQRSDVHNHTLVEDSRKFQCPNRCPDFTVIDIKDLVQRFDYEPGFRLATIYRLDYRSAIEGNFLYLLPWHGHKSAHGRNSLRFPFNNPHYAHDFTHASKARAKYWSHFWNVEANYWCYFNPHDLDYFTLSGIAGLRYFQLDEKFRLSMTRHSNKSSYVIHTHNSIPGIQLGLDFQINPHWWWLSWEAFVKVGGFANYMEQSQFLGDRDNKVTLRRTKNHEGQIGVFADGAVQLAFQWHRHINVHIGYEAIYLSGLANAPEQISRGTSKHSGKRIKANGDATIYGLFVGATFRF